MQDFETYEDVEEWLAPVGYDAFWRAIMATGLYGPGDKTHCDKALRAGIADMETVMSVTKRLALTHLVTQFDLRFRCDERRRPDLAVVD
ncbi:MAG: hypothetical protein QNJ44_20090 [Rhodobacter sp.]|nr:hypothetical protein [Rhodobacter sp.]